MVSTLLRPIQRPFEPKDDSLPCLYEFLKLLRELMKKSIELRYVHEDNLVVMHPGIEVSVLDIGLFDNDVVSFRGT